MSETLGVMVIWEGQGNTEYGLCYPDPRPVRARKHAACCRHTLRRKRQPTLEAMSSTPSIYEAHRIALGVPRGGIDFVYGDTFRTRATWTKLHGVDFDKGCFVGQEVVSRIEHRAIARARIVPVGFDGPPPEAGIPVMAGDRNVGMMGSGMTGRGLATLRLDRVEEALAKRHPPLVAGGIKLQPLKASWARFAMPGKTKAAE